jgi:hypothetical protein
MEIRLLLINGQNLVVHSKPHLNQNCVKYLNSHAQILLDRTGAQDNL